MTDIKYETNCVQRFLEYVKIDTQSSEDSDTFPSTPGQLDLLRRLKDELLDLGLEGVTEHIKTIGLFRQKARNVIKMSQILVDDYGGEVPNSRAALQSLPGVGRKTANVVLNMWWKMPAQAVDTHIFRVGNRTGICPGKDVDAVERAIEDHIPADYQQHAHHWLILHGRYICVARKPKCAACLIRDLCPFEDKNL